ncbi:1-acyl-sn-glycerol-3-phosphate acyltransferase [uncultured Marixanthomonas sp.]|uniref:1-acyl-sn-glycerol-3-phosphate acyltransferase n=1 Tax=uncultured Marixanthomonas sp. TaxID=757245 RepID=UPI0030DB9AEC|tara:strand:+ start:51853 stop:52389 length:537 start_codon:yes stop_codon:yes gene_type:complete
MGLARFIFYNLMGWQIKGKFDPHVKKAVIIVVPHTSWHDFYIGVFTRRILKVQINFIAKKELFTPPFGWYFKWMGGAPLDRAPGQNKVQAIAKIFSEKDEFRLALSPEGTRKKVESWKTGFYYIARTANVPVIPVAFDYKTKSVLIGKPHYLTDDIVVDTKELQKHYNNVVGKKPEYS